jgi:cytochrome c oxidase subunit II
MVVLMARFVGVLLSIVLAGAQTGQRRPDQVIAITAERFTFTPSEIKVKQGAVVEFVISSEDTDHGFHIPDAGIDATVPQRGKGELRIRFVARERGNYGFECSRPCGAGHNLMRGIIHVE